jgi:hypothetical protein
VGFFEACQGKVIEKTLPEKARGVLGIVPFGGAGVSTGRTLKDFGLTFNLILDGSSNLLYNGIGNKIKGGMGMSYLVDFNKVSKVGLESSPVKEALAGLRANEARYFMNKYKYEFTVVPASESQETLDYVNRIMKEERDIEFAAKPLETSRFQVENIKIAYVFYENGLVVNVMYTVDDPKKRAVGFKLSEGMEVPKELEGKFKFARQKSKLAGTIRGSFFVIKGEY